MKYNNGDRFILHSTNGLDYDIYLVNVNEYRPPGKEYGIDVYLNGNPVYQDVVFVDELFLDECEIVKEEEYD